MTRKDFITIAETIKDLDLRFVRVTLDGEQSNHAIQRMMIAEEFADGLAKTNAAFNRELFIQAATGQVPLNARKARV